MQIREYCVGKRVCQGRSTQFQDLGIQNLDSDTQAKNVDIAVQDLIDNNYQLGISALNLRYNQEENFAESVFHAFAHIIECQVLFNPRNIKSFVSTDGEGCERPKSAITVLHAYAHVNQCKLELMPPDILHGTKCKTLVRMMHIKYIKYF
jgi:hypothetical protein